MAEPLTTDELIRELRRPVYVYNLTINDERREAKTPRERSVRTRHQNAVKEIEDLLARWEGPGDKE